MNTETLQKLLEAADLLASVENKRIETPHGILGFSKTPGCNACGAAKPVKRGQRFCLPCSAVRKAENGKAAMQRLLAKRKLATAAKKMAKAQAEQVKTEGQC